MSPSEMPRSIQASGRRRPLGAFIIILVLCLISFAIGIFIGKNNIAAQQQVTSQAPLTHPVVRNATVAIADKKSIVDVVVGKDVAVSEEVSVQPALALAGSVSAVDGVGGDNSAAQQEVIVNNAVVSEQSPLGNGLNQTDIAKAVVAAPEKSEDAGGIVLPVVVKSVPAVVNSSPKVLSNSAAYVVQVGSFKKIADAEKVQDRLQAKFAVQVKRADLGQKGVWYRVLVGPVDNMVEAGKVKDRLQQEFKLTGFVKKNNE